MLYRNRKNAILWFVQQYINVFRVRSKFFKIKLGHAAIQLYFSAKEPRDKEKKFLSNRPKFILWKGKERFYIFNYFKTRCRNCGAASVGEYNKVI